MYHTQGISKGKALLYSSASYSYVTLAVVMRNRELKANGFEQ